MIIGVTGRAQHGKDTVGRRLVDRWGFQRFAFADGLRAVAVAANPIVDVIPDAPTPESRLAELVAVYGWDGAKRCPEVRRFLQALGTEGVRDVLGDDSWIRALERKIVYTGGPDRIVITDVRFPNEAEWIDAQGGIVVRVIRPNFDSGIDANHDSERLVDVIPASVHLVNDGTIDDLWTQVDDLIRGPLTRPSPRRNRGQV